MSFENLKQQTDFDGYIDCEVKGADFVLRPVCDYGIKPIKCLIDEHSDKINSDDDVRQIIN